MVHHLHLVWNFFTPGTPQSVSSIHAVNDSQAFSALGAGENTKRGNPLFPTFEQKFMAGCGKADDVLGPRPKKRLQPGE